jgi:imidazolonepropionase-like amidohydrolase
MKPRALAVGVFFATTALFGQTAKPAAAPARVYSIVGATVHTVSGPDIPKATIVVRDGKIASITPGGGADPGGPSIDGAGKHVYPPLFPPMTVLGLEEIAAIKPTLDKEEIGDVNPDARADVAVNLDSEVIAVGRSGGVLLAGVTPVGGVVSGSVAAMKLDGWTREDTTLKSPAAVTVFWPDLRIDRSPRAATSVRLQEKKRDEELEKLKNAFRDARAYGKARAAESQAGIPKHDADAKLAALLPALDGSIPVIVFAERLDQIRDAVKWAADEKLKLVIWGGGDAWRMAGELASAGVPVIVDTPLTLPLRDDDYYDARFRDAAVLDQAGVRVLFNDGGDDPSNLRNLPHMVATAVAYGFPREKAVAAVTLEPARLLGVADRVGSLEVGKDATFILTDGDLLDLRSHVVAAWVDGRTLDLTDRQKRLYERYRNRPRPAAPPR